MTAWSVRTRRSTLAGMCLALVAGWLLAITVSAAEPPAPDGVAAPSQGAISSPSTPSAQPAGTSTSGIGREWRAATFDTAGPGDFVGVVSWERGFAALGLDLGRGLRAGYGIWLSPDGERWSRVLGALLDVPTDAQSLRLLAHPGGLIVVAGIGTRLGVWRSEDGRHWRRLHDQSAFGLPSGSPGPGYFLDLRGAGVSGRHVVVNGIWLVNDCGACRAYFRSWTTDDGVHWVRHPRRPAMPDPIVGLAARTPSFVGFELVGWQHLTPAQQETCHDNTYRTMRSADGVRWHPVPFGELACGLLAAVDPSGAPGWVVGSTDEPSIPIIDASTDLHSWPEVFRGDQCGPLTDWTPDVIAADGIMVVAGHGFLGGEAHDTAWTLISVDGRRWELSTGWPAMRHPGAIGGLAIGHGRIVLVAGYGDVAILVTDAGGLGEFADGGEPAASPLPEPSSAAASCDPPGSPVPSHPVPDRTGHEHSLESGACPTCT